MRYKILCFLLPFVLGPFSGVYANVYKEQLDPTWSPDGSWMSYRNDLSGGQREYILVDLHKGLRERAFDHEKLAINLHREGAGNHSEKTLPLENLAFDLCETGGKVRLNGNRSLGAHVLP